MAFLSSALGALGGGSLGEAVVSVAVDTTPLKAGLAEAKTEVQSGTSSMASAFKTLGPAIGAAAVAGVVAFGAASVEAFQEAEAVLQKLKVAFGENTQALQDDASALQEWSGFSDEAILAADTIYARLGLTADQLHELIPLTLDFARATGQDAAASAQSLSKALLGSTRALKAVGISSEDFVVTGDRAKDLANLMGLLEDKIGGTAKAMSGNLDVQLQVLSNRFNDVQEKIGAALVPALLDIVDAASTLADIAGPLLEGFFTALAEGISLVTHDVSSLVDGIETLVGALPGVSSGTDDAAGGFNLMSFGMDSLKEGIDSAYHSALPFQAALGDVSDAANSASGATDAAAASNTSGADAATNAADAAAALADAQQAAADAAKAEKAAQDALAGGVIGLNSAMQDVADAQKVVNHLLAQGKGGTRAFADAETALLLAQLGLNSSFKEVIGNVKATEGGLKTARAELVSLGRQAGLSKSQIQSLVSDALESLRTKLAAAKAEADRLTGSLNAIPKTTNVSVITHYIQSHERP